MMKIFLFVSTVLTVSASWAQTNYIEESVTCSNGNVLQGELSTTNNAQFSVVVAEGKSVLVRDMDDSKTTYSLTFMGKDRDTQQPSYLAFAPNSQQFIVIISEQNELISILERDTDFKKCNGGLVIVDLISIVSDGV